MFNLFRPRRRKTAPSGFHPEWFAGGVSSVSGQVVTPDRAMREATVAACVRILAESVAQLPVKVFRADGETEDSGVLVELLRYPNAWQDSFQFREYMMVCLCLRGNFYARMVRNRAGEVVELLPLSPESVGVRLVDWEPVYSYTDALGRSAECGPDKMLHVRGESLDGVIGFSPIGYHRNTIGLSLATEAHGGRIFRNGARPGGILTHPSKLSDEALEHLRQSWAASHGGENAGGTAILEEGMDFKAVSMTNEDAQYLETRKFQRGLICGIFRVPPHMVADLEKATFSNIEHQSIEFAKYSILPWAVRIETAFRRALLTPEQRAAGLHIRLVLDGLERADIKTRYESYSIAVQNGILSPNECRALENRRPREGGDTFLQPLNMTDGTGAGVDESGVKSWIVPQPGKSHLPGHRLFDVEEFFREQKRDREPAAKAAADDEDDDDEHVYDDWADGEWSEEVAEQNAIMRRYREKLQKLYEPLIREECVQVRALVERFFPAGKRLKAADPAFMGALESLYVKLERSFAGGATKAMYHELAASVATAAAKKIGVSANVLDQTLKESVGRYVDIVAQDHAASSLGQIRRIILEGGDDFDIKRSLLERLNAWEKKGAKKLSMTQAVASANHYARDTYWKFGVKKIRWVAQGSKACRFCQRLNGRTTKIEAPFLPGGKEFVEGFTPKRKVKYPPIHRGCVCAIAPVLDKTLYPDELAGVKRGDPMPPDEAILANPQRHASLDSGFWDNCPATVAAYEARRRGYNVNALSFTDNPRSNQLHRNSLDIWMQHESGKPLKYESSGCLDAWKMFDYLQKHIEPGKRYVLRYASGYNKETDITSYHLVHVFRDADGVKWHDPQNGNVGSGKDGLLYRLNRIQYLIEKEVEIEGITHKLPPIQAAPQLLRVDNLRFNEDVFRDIMQGV